MNEQLIFMLSRTLTNIVHCDQMHQLRRHEHIYMSILCLAPQVLVIVAASHLDAVTFQICSQSFKIMPTALFAVWLLGQYLTPMQWASLPVLAVGVVLVTMNGSAGETYQNL